MSVVAELSIFPLDKAGGLSAYVARAVAVIKASGLAFCVGPMGTCVEGEWEEVMAVVSDCFAALKPDCERIYVSLKVDYRAGRTGGLTAKTAAVAARLENEP